MRRCEAESLRLDSETRITERRARLAFQRNERFWQTLICSDPHRIHVRNEIAIRKQQLGRENLRADFERLVQVGLIAIGNAQIAIAKEVFQLVGHGEDHRILRQAFRQHHRRAKVIVDKGAAQVSKPVRPFVNFDAVTRVNPPEIAGKHAR